MNAKEKFLKLVSSVEDLFMISHSCMGCGREIADGTKFNLCEKSFAECEKLAIFNKHLCKFCGESVDDDYEVCYKCKNTTFNFAKNRSVACYDGVVAKIIKDFKFNHRKYYASAIAKMMLALGDYFDDVDIITFVPISSARQKFRGFNQAEEIAVNLAKFLNKRVVPILTKVGDGKHQAELSQAERLKNLIGSFVLNKDAKELVKGKVVLVVDDVFTTGATLNECAKIIKQAKPASVKTVTLAKTKLNLSK